MTVTAVTRSRQPTTFADILDKGLVLDAFVRVSLVGIEVLTVDARIVLASVDTYLKFAEAVNRLDLHPQRQPPGIPELLQGVTHGAAKSKVKGALHGVKEKGEDALHGVKEKGSELKEKASGALRHVVPDAVPKAAHRMKEIASDVVGGTRRKNDENEARPEDRKDQGEDEREEDDGEERDQD